MMTETHLTQEASVPKVILVDDEEAFRNTVGKRLKRRGLTVTEAIGGEHCLALLKLQAVDVVVLDVKMPDMDGLETLDIIKQRYPAMEVILLTGKVSTADGVEGIKKGAFDYLSKPVEMDHLVKKIRQAHEKIFRESEKQKEQARQEKLKQQMIAAERLAALGTLSTGVAHEINNPLAMMHEAVGYLRLILEKQEMASFSRGSDLVRGIDTIEKGVDRIKRITHLLLGFVKKSGQPCSRTDLNQIMAETIELAARETKNREINIVRNMPDAPVVIVTDPYELRQVLINVLTNAIQAIRRDGTITVSIKASESEALLEIVDTGEGIPEENRRHLFEPFFTTKPPDQGTGLGLYVSRRIMERLGGNISIESSVGRGTSVRLSLPDVPLEDAAAVNDAETETSCTEIINKLKETNNNA